MKILLESREWQDQGAGILKAHGQAFVEHTADGFVVQPLHSAVPQGHLVGTGDVFSGWCEEENLPSLCKTISMNPCTALLFRVGKGDQQPWAFTVCEIRAKE